MAQEHRHKAEGGWHIDRRRRGEFVESVAGKAAAGQVTIDGRNPEGERAAGGGARFQDRQNLAEMRQDGASVESRLDTLHGKAHFKLPLGDIGGHHKNKTRTYTRTAVAQFLILHGRRFDSQRLRLWAVVDKLWRKARRPRPLS